MQGVVSKFRGGFRPGRAGIVQLEVGLAQLLVENTESHPTIIQMRRHIGELKQKRNDELKRVIVQAMAKGSDPKIFEDFAKALAQVNA